METAVRDDFSVATSNGAGEAHENHQNGLDIGHSSDCIVRG
jgi:hypothetical protein